MIKTIYVPEFTADGIKFHPYDATADIGKMYAGAILGPGGHDGLKTVTKDDIKKVLSLTDEEASYLVNNVRFDYWYKGDADNPEKKWTFDADDCYNDLSVKNFYLSNILDAWYGSKFVPYADAESVERAKKIENMEGLKKFLHFSANRATIKEMYFGKWKNEWNLQNK